LKRSHRSGERRRSPEFVEPTLRIVKIDRRDDQALEIRRESSHNVSIGGEPRVGPGPTGLCSPSDDMILPSQSRPIFNAFLLLCLGLQGIGPDAQSVASMRSLEILAPCEMPLDSFSHHEGFGDAVCGRLESSQRNKIASTDLVSSSSAGRILPPLPSPAQLRSRSRVAGCRALAPSAGRLTTCLCRLVC
jgi:hypothetical protein